MPKLPTRDFSNASLAQMVLNGSTQPRSHPHASSRSTPQRDYSDRRMTTRSRLMQQDQPTNSPLSTKQLKAALHAIAQQGRGHDTQLALLNHHTARLLDNLIHHGHKQINPKTGLREYWKCDVCNGNHKTENHTKYVQNNNQGVDTRYKVVPRSRKIAENPMTEFEEIGGKRHGITMSGNLKNYDWSSGHIYKKKKQESSSRVDKTIKKNLNFHNIDLEEEKFPTARNLDEERFPEDLTQTMFPEFLKTLSPRMGTRSTIRQDFPTEERLPSEEEFPSPTQKKKKVVSSKFFEVNHPDHAALKAQKLMTGKNTQATSRNDFNNFIKNNKNDSFPSKLDSSKYEKIALKNDLHKPIDIIDQGDEGVCGFASGLGALNYNYKNAPYAHEVGTPRRKEMLNDIMNIKDPKTKIDAFKYATNNLKSVQGRPSAVVDAAKKDISKALKNKKTSFLVGNINEETMPITNMLEPWDIKYNQMNRIPGSRSLRNEDVQKLRNDFMKDNLQKSNMLNLRLSEQQTGRDGLGHTVNSSVGYFPKGKQPNNDHAYLTVLDGNFAPDAGGVKRKGDKGPYTTKIQYGNPSHISNYRFQNTELGAFAPMLKKTISPNQYSGKKGK